MAEGSETPNGEQGAGPEGRPRRNEGDLLAERRARRAAESGELALTRRAEAAEATVQTLERHVASLQQRLREAEDERARMTALIEAERTDTLERENELRRVKQREYAEQQLRVEAEERLLSGDRESRVEIERLGARLSSSERDGRELTRRLASVQRQLAEAEQAAAAELADVRADLRSVADQDLQERLSDLERRALEIQDGLQAERDARAQSERLLAGMREGHRRMESLLGEMKGIVGRVNTALANEQWSAVEQQAAMVEPEVAGAEMADALAAAVERLRARAQAAPDVAPEAPDVPSEAPDVPSEAPDVPSEAPDVPPVAPDVAPVQTGGEVTDEPSQQAAEQPPRRPAHKHSMSWFARWRNRRKQRRSK
jgi:chromosome segregation ATPase